MCVFGLLLAPMAHARNLAEMAVAFLLLIEQVLRFFAMLQKPLTRLPFSAFANDEPSRETGSRFAYGFGLTEPFFGKKSWTNPASEGTTA
jgi:hypothetical protein